MWASKQKLLPNAVSVSSRDVESATNSLRGKNNSVIYRRSVRGTGPTVSLLTKRILPRSSIVVASAIIRLVDTQPRTNL